MFHIVFANAIDLIGIDYRLVEGLCAFDDAYSEVRLDCQLYSYFFYLITIKILELNSKKLH